MNLDEMVDDMVNNCTHELEVTKGDRKQTAYRKLLTGFRSRLKNFQIARRHLGECAAPLAPEIEQEYEELLGERLRDQAKAREVFALMLTLPTE